MAAGGAPADSLGISEEGDPEAPPRTGRSLAVADAEEAAPQQGEADTEVPASQEAAEEEPAPQEAAEDGPAPQEAAAVVEEDEKEEGRSEPSTPSITLLPLDGAPDVVVLGAWAFMPAPGRGRGRKAVPPLVHYERRLRAFLTLLVEQVREGWGIKGSSSSRRGRAPPLLRTTPPPSHSLQPSYAAVWARGRLVWRPALPTELGPLAEYVFNDTRHAAPPHLLREAVAKANDVAARAIRELAPEIGWLSQQGVVRHVGHTAAGAAAGALHLTTDGVVCYPVVQVRSRTGG